MKESDSKNSTNSKKEDLLERDRENKLDSKDLKENDIDKIISANSNRKEINNLIEIGTTELKVQRQKLIEEIEELSKRKSQIEDDIKSSFSGQSDSIARRVKGFQDYLIGALQTLAQSAEQMDLVVQPIVVKPSPLDEKTIIKEVQNTEDKIVNAIADTFKPDAVIIRDSLKQFIGQPDFYASPWKLRRSLDPEDLEILEDWFFNMGGRGAQPSRGNRTKNILVGAGVISIMGELYGDRFQTLVLASQPERLGEWRRGLQESLGLTREDFGPSSGIVLFERADGLVERADKLEERGEVPLIILDAAETSIEIPILQFPLWLAFAASQEELYQEEEFY
tara:strand:+ start:2721 stop:3731 length:1011 start_codon:yes stop_codon:yes gene_type:complete